jgi:putative DNA primase/helicase
MTHPFAGLSGGSDIFDDNDRDKEDLNLDPELEDYPSRLIEDYSLKTLRDTGEIWYYDEERGIFAPGAVTMLAAKIEDDKGHPRIDEDGKIHESKLSTHKVNEYLDHIRRRTYIDRNDFNPSAELLACKNCMINLLTSETKPFSPEFLCTTQIPIVYDYRYVTNQVADFFRLVEDRRGKIIGFLYDIMSPEDVEVFLDFLAYCLWRQYKFNYWLLLHGAGFNGKSILLNLIEAFLGKGNVSGETLDRLLHERFAVAQLYGKMANVDADVSPDVIFNNTGILKKLTGNDLHTGEEKFKPPFKFVNNAKLIFSCNKIPETDDQTDAFFRRLIIINLTTQFFGDKEDFDLIQKLTVDGELTILLHEILSRLPRILREGLRKTTNESIAENYDKYTKGSNPVKAFYEKAIGPQAGGRVPKVEMLEHYYRFCREFGLTPESDQSFSRRLSVDFRLKVKQFRRGHERIYCWLDVRLRNWTVEQEEEDKTIQDFDYSGGTKEAMK